MANLLFILQILFTPSCSNCDEIDSKGIYLYTIKEAEYYTILEAEKVGLILMDREIKEYIFPNDTNLNLHHIVDRLNGNHTEIGKTSNDLSDFTMSLLKFCKIDYQDNTKKNLPKKDYHAMKPIMINGENYFYHAIKVKMRSIRVSVDNNQMNLLYLNPNVKVDPSTNKIIVYFVKEMREDMK